MWFDAGDLGWYLRSAANLRKLAVWVDKSEHQHVIDAVGHDPEGGRSLLEVWEDPVHTGVRMPAVRIRQDGGDYSTHTVQGFTAQDAYTGGHNSFCLCGAAGGLT